MAPERYRPGGVPVVIGTAKVVELEPRVYRGRLTGMYFETDKCFLLPSAMTGIRGLTRFYARRKGLEVLVVGHADTAGDPGPNLELSRARAEAIRAFLLDDVAAWVRWFGDAVPRPQRWGVREVQHMLTALTDGHGQLYDGPPSGADDAPTQAAVRRFQSWSNRAKGTALAVDGSAGPATRPEIVRAYMSLDGTTLPLRTPVLTHGCGEFHPVVPSGDGQVEPRNRRVEVFLFEGPTRPPPGPCNAPGCPEYAKWVAAVVEEVDFQNPPSENSGVVTFRLIDEERRGLAGVAVWIRHPDGSKRRHVADDQGEVRLSAKPGEGFAVAALCETQVTTDIASVTIKAGAA